MLSKVTRRLQPSSIKEVALSRYRVVEVCAGAGGQSLGLELAGFEHDLSVELDQNAAATLRHNRPHWKVAVGDVANLGLGSGRVRRRRPARGRGAMPAVHDRGQAARRHRRARPVRLGHRAVRHHRPRALMLENVRGLSLPRFAAYRQHVLDRLASLGIRRRLAAAARLRLRRAAAPAPVRPGGDAARRLRLLHLAFAAPR